jgi:hypothetical protein
MFCCQAVTIGAVVLLANSAAQAQTAGYKAIAFDEYDDMSRHSTGGIIDWIQKLSGPRVWRAGVYLGIDLVDAVPWVDTGRGVNTRLAYLRSFEVNNRSSVTPANTEISVESWQVTVTVPVVNVGPQLIELGLGYNYHTFTTEVPDSSARKFNHYSIPAFAEAPIRIGRTPWLINLAAGAHIFPAFNTTDFRPATVNVDRSDPEVVPYAFLTLEYRF